MKQKVIINKYIKTVNKLRKKLKREPDINEIADELGINKEKINDIIRINKIKRVD